MPKESFLKFSVGKETFYMNIHDIQFVVPIEEFQNIPRTPSFIKGITEIHGNIVTLINLSQIFGAGNNGTVPFHAALLTHPFNNMAICLHSEFDVVEANEVIPLSEKKVTEQGGGKIVGKQHTIKSEECRVIGAADLIQLCEDRIIEYIKKNLQTFSPGEE